MVFVDEIFNDFSDALFFLVTDLFCLVVLLFVDRDKLESFSGHLPTHRTLLNSTVLKILLHCNEQFTTLHFNKYNDSFHAFTSNDH